MPLTFPTTSLKKPSGVTALPSGLKRPAFGTLYGFDAQGGASALTDQLAYPGGLFTSSNFEVSVQPLFHFDGSILDGASADNNPSNGTAVSTWGDRSGQSANYDASQSTASQQPIFQGNNVIFGGAPTGAQNDFLEIATKTDNVDGTGWTLCVVANKVETSGGAKREYAPVGRHPLQNAYYLPLNFRNGVTYYFVGNSSVSTAGYGPHFESIQQFVTIKDTSDDATYYLQGNNAYKTGVHVTNGPSGLFGNIGHNGYYHYGPIYEVILWGSTLSTADLNVVRTYFNTKYTDLPSSTAFS
tara:strand:- start:279 stop:1175 length:897 start_codon:yes stop_codon:yes gene_type:complete